jgi:hypothetical protein
MISEIVEMPTIFSNPCKNHAVPKMDVIGPSENTNKMGTIPRHSGTTQMAAIKTVRAQPQSKALARTVFQ